jgi:hypothetical protein
MRRGFRIEDYGIAPKGSDMHNHAVANTIMKDEGATKAQWQSHRKTRKSSTFFCNTARSHPQGKSHHA